MTKCRPRVIGITGGVAAGKSTVARMFERFGATVIDADALAHDELESEAVCAKIRKSWGPEFFGPDGRPDRRRIGERVFQDAEKLRELTGWIHPGVRKKMKILLERALKDSSISFIIVDAPLLVEADLDAWCDVVLYIEATPSLRNERARSQRGWTHSEVQRRESAQASLDEKRRRASVVIDNSGPPEQTFAQVQRLVQSWMQASPTNKPQYPFSEGVNHG